MSKASEIWHERVCAFGQEFDWVVDTRVEKNHIYLVPKRITSNGISMKTWREEKMERVLELLTKLNAITPVATMYKVEFRDRFSGSVNVYRHGNLNPNKTFNFSGLTEAENRLKDEIIINI